MQVCFVVYVSVYIYIFICCIVTMEEDKKNEKQKYISLFTFKLIFKKVHITLFTNS